MELVISVKAHPNYNDKDRVSSLTRWIVENVIERNWNHEATKYNVKYLEELTHYMDTAEKDNEFPFWEGEGKEKILERVLESEAK